MTTTTEKADPHLATIRTIARTVEARGGARFRYLGKAIEQARFNVYKALQGSAPQEAADWLNALEAAVVPIPEEDPQRKQLDLALSGLRGLIGAEREVHEQAEQAEAEAEAPPG